MRLTLPPEAVQHRIRISAPLPHNLFPPGERIPVIVEYTRATPPMTARLVIRLVRRSRKFSALSHTRPYPNFLPPQISELWTAGRLPGSRCKAASL